MYPSTTTITRGITTTITHPDGSGGGDTTPGGASDALLLEDGTFGVLLEDGTSFLLLETA